MMDERDLFLYGLGLLGLLGIAQFLIYFLRGYLVTSSFNLILKYRRVQDFLGGWHLATLNIFHQE